MMEASVPSASMMRCNASQNGLSCAGCAPPGSILMSTSYRYSRIEVVVGRPRKNDGFLGKAFAVLESLGLTAEKAEGFR